jgi:hypothetical protein
MKAARSASGKGKEAAMQKHVVEYAGIPVGILVPFEDSLKFVAVKFHVMGLDGQRFRSLVDVRRAIGAHLAGTKAMAA